MTDRTEPDLERAEADAAAWLVRLAEAPGDAALRARFEAWRDAYPQNAATWARTDQAYEILGRHRPRDRALWQVERRPRKPWRLAFAAASACAALALAFLPGLTQRLQADVTTATAELGSLALPDGTEVRLAPESAIDNTFSQDQRSVRLLKGEAYFSVAHDPQHPFRVTAGDTSITVLGTAFDVRFDDQGTTVSVEHGKVRVEEGDAVHLLGAGDWLALFDDKASEVGHDAVPEVAAWRFGRFAVRDRPAAEIVEALRPYYRGLILLRNPAFESHRVSGIYDLTDPFTTLRSLAESYDAKLVQISPWITVVTEK